MSLYSLLFDFLTLRSNVIDVKTLTYSAPAIVLNLVQIWWWHYSSSLHVLWKFRKFIRVLFLPSIVQCCFLHACFVIKCSLCCYVYRYSTELLPSCNGVLKGLVKCSHCIKICMDLSESNKVQGCIQANISHDAIVNCIIFFGLNNYLLLLVGIISNWIINHYLQYSYYPKGFFFFQVAEKHRSTSHDRRPFSINELKLSSLEHPQHCSRLHVNNGDEHEPSNKGKTTELEEGGLIHGRWTRLQPDKWWR